MLSRESSAEPGKWQTATAEYQRGMMDAIGDPAVREIWVMKSAQIGWTEILGNAVGYFIDQDPSPMLLIQPTLDMAEAWSKDRFAPMLRDTPALRGLVKDARARDSGNTMLHKQFPGGHVTMAGANSPASLASRPVRVVLCDEVDRYPVSAGTEGDPIKLAQKRSATFWNRRFLAGSTPTVKGASRVEIGFASSDQRRFFVPCPHCQTFQVLQWKRVKWPEGRPDEAFYACAHCDAALTDGDRVGMIRAGEWRATAPSKGIAGFHVWEAYSPWRKLSEIVTDFLAAKPYPDLLKVWVNTSLGETWEDPSGERLIADTLAARAEDYETWTAPAAAVFATVGADVQHDRIELGVYAYGPGEETWAVAHEVIFGAPTDARLWAAVDDLLARQVRRADDVALPILASAFDAGDGATTGFVLDYCRQRRRRSVLAIKGQSQPGKPPIGRPSKVDVNVRGIAIPRGAELWPVGSDTIKGILMARLREEGFIHFPATLPTTYYEGLSSERLITKFRNGIPHRIWVKDKAARNEPLDCFVYAYAAACYAGLKRANWAALRSRLKPWGEAPPSAPMQPPEPAPNPAPRRVPASGARDGFGSADWNL
jgi:phage terminase large subunit GpA-like protein